MNTKIVGLGGGFQGFGAAQTHRADKKATLAKQAFSLRDLNQLHVASARAAYQ